MSFTIRDLKTYPEMLQVHKLQQEIWGLDDPTMGLHPPVLKTAAENGGVVLGAFDEETGQMVGFLFGFIGREKGGRFKLCSQVTGVHKAWRKHGVAEALKQAQRRHTLEQELELVTWTYDPLEGPNAHLNLHKLRAISRRYIRDLFGADYGELNKGLPTDRLLVEWWVTAAWVDQPATVDIEQAAPIFEMTGQGLERKIVKSHLDLEAEFLALESVADVHALKAANLDLALAWRLQLREAFEAYFDRGFMATDFVSTVHEGERRNRYMLQKATPELMARVGIPGE